MIRRSFIGVWGMFGTISRWIERQRALTRLCREDARQLLAMNPNTAYYKAPRIAARASMTKATTPATRCFSMTMSSDLSPKFHPVGSSVC